jgi:hypothetical protein
MESLHPTGFRPSRAHVADASEALAVQLKEADLFE